MSNPLLNLVINILLMAFAIFSVLELIYDKSTKGAIWQKIKPRGWLLIIFALLTVGVNLYNDLISERKQEASDKAKAKVDSELSASQRELFQLQVSTKDIIIGKIDTTYLNSVKESNTALARYHLKFTDSLRAVVSTLKLDAVHPQLLIAPCETEKPPAFIKKDKGINTLKIQFVSNSGTSYNIMVHCYLIIETNINFTILQSDQLTMGEKFITEDVRSTMGIDLSPDILDYSDVIVFITGTFTKDPDGKNIIPYNEAFKYNLKENKYVGSWDVSFQQLKKVLNIK